MTPGGCPREAPNPLHMTSLCPHFHTLSSPRCSPSPNTHIPQELHPLTWLLPQALLWMVLASPLASSQAASSPSLLCSTQPTESNLLNPRMFLLNPQAWAWWCVVPPPHLGSLSGQGNPSLHNCPALTLPCLSLHLYYQMTGV